MAKKKVVRTTTRRASQPTAAPESSDLDAARERLRAARNELREARRAYFAARLALGATAEDEASPEAEATAMPWEDCSVNELVDESLRCVRRYPALGILTAACGGLLLGKIFRR